MNNQQQQNHTNNNHPLLKIPFIQKVLRFVTPPILLNNKTKPPEEDETYEAKFTRLNEEYERNIQQKKLTKSFPVLLATVTSTWRETIVDYNIGVSLWRRYAEVLEANNNKNKQKRGDDDSTSTSDIISSAGGDDDEEDEINLADDEFFDEEHEEEEDEKIEPDEEEQQDRKLLQQIKKEDEENNRSPFDKAFLNLIISDCLEFHATQATLLKRLDANVPLAGNGLTQKMLRNVGNFVKVGFEDFIVDMGWVVRQMILAGADPNGEANAPFVLECSTTGNLAVLKVLIGDDEDHENNRRKARLTPTEKQLHKNKKWEQENPNQRAIGAFNPLFLALWFGHVNIVDYLIEKHLDKCKLVLVNMKTKFWDWGTTCLNAAIINNAIPIRIVKDLVQKCGANVKLTPEVRVSGYGSNFSRCAEYQQLPIMMCFRQEYAYHTTEIERDPPRQKLPMKKGATPEPPSPEMIEYRKEQERIRLNKLLRRAEIFDFLINNRVPPSSNSFADWTGNDSVFLNMKETDEIRATRISILDRAEKSEKVEKLKQMYSGEKNLVFAYDRSTPFLEACRTGVHPEVIQKMLEAVLKREEHYSHRSREDITLQFFNPVVVDKGSWFSGLSLAIVHGGNVDLVKYLMEESPIDVTFTDKSGSNARDFAMISSNNVVTKYVSSKRDLFSKHKKTLAFNYKNKWSHFEQNTADQSTLFSFPLLHRSFTYKCFRYIKKI